MSLERHLPLTTTLPLVKATLLLAAVCALLALALGIPFAGEHAPSAFDTAAANAIHLSPGLLDVLVLPTEPYVLLPALALAVFWCLRKSRHADAARVVAGPAIAVVLNAWVLKPLYDRWKNDTLVYPSGHTVSMVATLTVLVLLTRKLIALVIADVLLLAAAIGLVGLGYHYLTDVIGGALFGAAVALLTWSVPRRAPEPSAGLPPADTSSGSPR